MSAFAPKGFADADFFRTGFTEFQVLTF